jgi:hypothetical protein
MTTLGYDPFNTSQDMTTPPGVGNVSAIDILNFRHNDGSNQLANVPGTIDGPYSDYTGFVPVNSPSTIVDPNQWQPLLVNGVEQIYVTPQ